MTEETRRSLDELRHTAAVDAAVAEGDEDRRLLAEAARLLDDLGERSQTTGPCCAACGAAGHRTTCPLWDLRARILARLAARPRPARYMGCVEKGCPEPVASGARCVEHGKAGPT